MRVCPGCGATSGEKEFIGQFCIDCYLKDHPDLVVFHKLELPVCVHCGRVKVGGKWYEPSEAILKKYMKSRMKTDLEKPDLILDHISVKNSGIELKVKICGLIENSHICLDRDLYIKFLKTQCPVCAKMKGDYWEVKIQIRGPREKQQEVLNDMEKLAESISMKDARARVIRVREIKEGIDVYVGSKKIARDLVKRMKNKFHAEIKRTRKLTGEDAHKGKRIYKETFSVRL